jgi:hypothetical protein
MESDTAAASSVDAAGDVMAAIDGNPERLIIADVSRDEAWLAMPLDATAAVADHA